MAKKRYIQAINDALFEEMERDPKIILFGEDVEISMFGDTQGLHARFGASRIRNTPICEATLTGMAVGAAASGYRVVLHMMFSNFIYTGFDAIANQIAKLRLMTGGQIDSPDHDSGGLRWRTLDRRAAFGRAASAAHESRRDECGGPGFAGRCEGSSQNGIACKQPDLLP